MSNIKESDIVMCTVKNIEGTTVFVDIDENGSGSIVFSEIAAGRIRNIREYVSIGKKIVCKVLKVYPDHAELSLRRVIGKEREEIQERYRKNKTFSSMLKAISPESEKIISKIKEEYELWDFFDRIKENPSLLEKFFKKSETESIIKFLAEKRDKKKIVKKIFLLKSYSENGLDIIKEILKTKDKSISIHYLGSSNFSISASAKAFKDAEHLILSTLKQIEAKAKEKKAFFELKEK